MRLRRHDADVAAALLARLGHEVAAATDDAAPPRPSPPQRRGSLDRRLVGAAVVVIALVVGGVVMARPSRARPPAIIREVAPRPRVVPPTTPAAASDIAIDGNVVAKDGRRWQVGEPGDVVLVGRWDCSGTDTVALFRPSLGALFRFDGWSASGADQTVTPVTTVAGATTARAADIDGDDCDEVIVERRVGAPAVVRLRPTAPPPRSPTTAPRP